MKLILFDLGDTLESAGVLRPGARETLEAITSMRVGVRPAAVLGLASDFEMPTRPSDVPFIQQRYYTLLDELGIRSFFEPLAERVTLSTEVGVFKPDEAIFQAALAPHPALTFADTLFVTENRDHVVAARHLGLAAVHVRGPGQFSGDVDEPAELVGLVRSFTGAGDADDIAVLTVGPDAADAITDTAAAHGVSWTRLGDVLVLRGPVPGVDEVVRRLGVPATRRPAAPGRHLHLVTQIGRLFRDDHPDVPVVVDKGRFLVVELPAGAPPIGDSAHGACYRARPLPADAVVFAQRQAGPGNRVAPADRAAPVCTVDRAAFEADLHTLAALRTRQSTSVEFLDALDWARTRLDDLGYATRMQTVALDGGTTRNLVADRAGTGDRRDVVVVTAHLDSVNVAGSAAPAPGADDNASGSAGVIAIGEALAHHPAEHDLRLILFGGEEQGLFGSRHYVDGLDVTERTSIRAVVNMDMIACRNTDAPTVLLEGAALSQSVIDALGDAAAAHTSLVVQTSLFPFNSDHVPFLERRIPAVLTIEGADSANDRVHTERDTVDHLDIDLAVDILRMNTAFVEQALGHSDRIDLTERVKEELR